MFCRCNVASPLECRAVPLCQFRSRFIGALAEIEYRGFRRPGRASIVIFEKELAQLVVPISSLRAHRFIREAGRSRCGVGIEGGTFEPAIARPEPATDYFVGISVARHAIGVRLLRSTPD